MQRRTIVLLLLITAVPARAQDWTVVPLGTTADLYAVENTPLSNHWVVGAGGFAARSNSARTQWTHQDPQTTASLYSVVEPGGSEVWMGAGQGVVRLWLYAAWFHRDLPMQAEFRVFSRSGGDLIAIGPGGRIFRTIDASTWTSVPSGTTQDLNAGDGLVSSRAWIVGDHGTILRTLDGTTWTPVQSRTTVDLHGIAQLDLIHLYAVGDNGTILKSDDGGGSWSERPSGTTASLHAVSISKQNNTHLIAAGAGGTVLKSTDGGDTWCLLTTGTTVALYGAEAVSDSEFLVCGAGGLLLRTTSGGGICAATSVPAGGVGPPVMDLAGPFPQPSNGTATFRAPCDQGQSFHAELFDVTGRMVLALREIRALAAGQQEITLDTRTLTPGVYMVRVRSEGHPDALRRFVVAR